MLYCLCFLIPAYTACTAIYWALTRAPALLPHSSEPILRLRGFDFQVEHKLRRTTGGTVCDAVPSQGETTCFFFFKSPCLFSYTTFSHSAYRWCNTWTPASTLEFNGPGINMTYCLVIRNFWFHWEKERTLVKCSLCNVKKKKSVGNSDCMWRSGQSQQV